MGKTKAIVDTNILISALGWKGNPRKVFEKIINGEVELVISDDIFRELSRVLDYPKFIFTEEQKDRFKSLILEISTFVEPIEKINAVKEDPEDNKIIECAVSCNADYIVTGDRHLLNLKEFRGIKIRNARDFLQSM